MLVTVGATEAIAAALLALCEPGDEVVAFEPTYDSYAACAAMAGARLRLVRLHAPDWSFDPADLAAAVGPRTRLVLLNSPHNPTGKVFSPEELALVAALCVDHDLLAVTDEVYEHLVFDGTHVPLASLPGMASRTLTVSSGGKTFSFTGWKVGWASGTAPLVTAVRSAKQFLTYTSPAAFQLAIARGLASPPQALHAPRPSWRPNATCSATASRRSGTPSTGPRRPTSPPPMSRRWHPACPHSTTASPCRGVAASSPSRARSSTTPPTPQRGPPWCVGPSASERTCCATHSPA